MKIMMNIKMVSMMTMTMISTVNCGLAAFAAKSK